MTISIGKFWRGEKSGRLDGGGNGGDIFQISVGLGIDEIMDMRSLMMMVVMLRLAIKGRLFDL